MTSDDSSANKPSALRASPENARASDAFDPAKEPNKTEQPDINRGGGLDCAALENFESESFLRALLRAQTLVCLFRGVFVGAIGALAVAALETYSVSRAVAEMPNVLRLWASDAGLVVPVGILLGLCGALAALALHAPNVPSWIRLRRWLSPIEPRRRARLAAIALISPVVCTLFVLGTAHISVRVLSVQGASAALGALMGAAAIGTSLLCIGVILGLARIVGVRLRKKPPDPVRAGIIGLFCGTLIFVLLVGLGNTSGAGEPLAMFGVFRRQELDLRAPLFSLLLLAMGYLSGWLSQKVHLRGLILGALLPTALTGYSGRIGMNSRAVSNAIERSSPLGRIVLGPLRRFTDHDKDGFSASFGGGDCDDNNAAINPSVDDIPGNGIDEDCSGKDAAIVANSLASARPTGSDLQITVSRNLNLVLLTVDTVRADVLFDARHVVPELEKLALKSIVYTHAYAPASYTGKSVGPFIIGKNSSETQRDFSHFNAFRKERFVQQRLQSAGIRTVSVQGYWYFYLPPYGFERGFDVIDSKASPGQGYVEGDRTTNADKQADQVIEQLKNAENTTKQFYLWSHFTDPHAEYVSHPGFDFGNDSRGRYLGEVSFVDHQLGRIFEVISNSSFADRTVIIVTSDHGEAFGEHGMLRHGFELWEPLIRVPLIIFIPPGKGRHIDARRSLLDLVPTVLDLMSVPSASGQGVDFLSGHSLAPELLSTEGSQVEERPVFVDMSAGPNNAERQAYIHKNFKLIASMGRPLGLYDLATDPEEKHDLLDNEQLRSEITAEFKAFRHELRVVHIAESKSN